MISSRCSKTFIQGAMTWVLALLVVAGSAPAVAQTQCQVWTDVLLDTSFNCTNDPRRDRSSDVDTMYWKGHEYLVLNQGNELTVWNVDDRANPKYVTGSEFEFGTVGDSDYDLIDFDVCNDCRYGALDHKKVGTVIFDFGTGSVPSFAGHVTYYQRNRGNTVFLRGSQQYLISNSVIAGECSIGSTLYTLDSLTSLGAIGCVESAPGTPFPVTRGWKMRDGDQDYLFLAGSGQIGVFEASGYGSSLSLNLVATPTGMFGRDFGGLSIDVANRRAVSADSIGRVVTFWDLSKPYAPAMISGWTISYTARVVSMRAPAPGAPAMLFMADPGDDFGTRTFLVDDGGPTPVDESFWTDPSLPHNVDHDACVYPSGGVLAPDGTALYLSRYARHQVYDLSACLGPTEAVAQVGINPSTVFPGGSVLISDQTYGSYDRWAVWVTQGSNPDSTPLAGSSSPSITNPHDVPYTIYQQLAEGVDYYAHVSIESDDVAPTTPRASKIISVDRSPQADFTINPAAAITGETVTLTATAEGVPATTQPYVWTITSDSGVQPPKYGQSIEIDLAESGTWTFDLVVNYEHGASGVNDPDSDTLYEARASQTISVTSVAADFVISPAGPLNTLPITLNGATSNWAAGANVTWDWVVRVAGVPVFWDCPNAQSCTIPANTLNPGLHAVTLTLTNTANGDTSTKTLPMNVGDGAIQPTFDWTPGIPEIGQSTTFSIDGVPVSVVDKATWNFGGAGCDGAAAIQVCEPSTWTGDCKAWAFKYASAGTKNVSLTIEIGGNTFSAPSQTLTVSSSGSCSDGGGGTCSYNLSASTFTLGPGGGERSFFVTTTSGCSWIASENSTWITITSDPTQSGSGTVTFTVAPNTGPTRIGTISAGGKSVYVTQNPPNVPVNFDLSKSTVAIGEAITFTADPALQVVNWKFGEADCRGNNPNFSCTYLPSGACNEVEWAYPTSGQKTVTMVLADGRTKTKYPTVANSGECCLADSKPHAEISMSTDSAFTREPVVFSDASTKVAQTKALGFTWSPAAPEIGESVQFDLSGVSGDVTAEWDFGGAGCSGFENPFTCTPMWTDCHSTAFKYGSGGSKTVTVTVKSGADVIGTLSKTITVANVGTCAGGGGGGCSYGINPTTSSFPPAGGNGGFAVETGAECAWTATTTASTWLNLTSSSGTGPGLVNFTITENGGTATRTAYVRVGGENHRVTQTATPSEVNKPTAWEWTVHLIDEAGDDVLVATSSEPQFSHSFEEPGQYRVRLIASNCFGSDAALDYITVETAPIEDFVVGAAVRLEGARETKWESDFRFHNPCAEDLDVRIEYQPEGTNNSNSELVFREFLLRPAETRVFADIIEAIPGLAGDELSGSVRIVSSSASGCKVLSVSRTFNVTPEGSLGLFVPALPVKRGFEDFLDLTGLIQNDQYRSNLRLLNYGVEDAWVAIAAFDRNGNPVGEARSALVPGNSTKQINEVAVWLGIDGNLAPFSLRAAITGLDVQAFGTVVDNLTGDSVLYLSSFHDENRIWVVGAASLEGVNQSRWRTDLWLYNPTADWLSGEVEFVVGDDPAESYGFQWPTLGTHRTKQYLNIVGDELGLEETRGYLVLTGADGGPAPQVAARTYNLDPGGGTYGLNLRAFGADDLLLPGEAGYIAGVSNSADPNAGFRTNLGLLNTDRQVWTGVKVTLIDLAGGQIGEPVEMLIAPGVLRQFDLAKKFGVGGVTGTASVKIEVTEGGAVAAYATEIDNRTQDSIYIPAQRAIFGLAR